MTQCTSTISWTTTASAFGGRELPERRTTVRCQLSAGHDDLHRAVTISWTDGAADQGKASAALAAVETSDALVGWTTTYEDDGYVHVRPDNDLIAHTDQDCVCGPTPERVPNPNGPEGWMYTHHSLDGRENQEPTT